MKKSIIYIVTFLFALFLINANVEAKSEKFICRYNLTGVSASVATDYVTVIVYDDYTTEAIGSDNADWAFTWFDNQKDSIRNWGEEFFGVDAREEFEKTNQCPDFLLYNSQADDQFTLLTYDALLGDIDITDGGWHDFWTTEPIIFTEVVSADTVITDTCEYPGFNLNYNAEGLLVSIDSGTAKLIPTVDMIFNRYPPSVGCQSVRYCVDDDMVVKGDGYLFFSSDGFDLYDIDASDCETLDAKNNPYKGNVCYKYNNLFNGNAHYGILGLYDYAIEYDNCNGNAACVSETIGKYNEQKAKLIDWCKAIVNNNHYDDDCLNQCLNLSQELAALENDIGIRNDSVNDECSFGESLVIWIANIVKWLKYIVPIIVIIFGILDFIKATGADKEDEMKKAQKNFVIRLIAAALVFIIPFIIEFILGVFNFEANGCGIIDL